MSSKEKMYHIVNTVVIPPSALAAIVLVKTGRMADAGQISMSDPGMSLASLLLFVVLGICGIWIVVSGFIHKNQRTALRKGEKGNLKPFAGLVMFFIILVVSFFFTPLWMIGLAVFAIYLFVISVRALILDCFPKDRNN